MKPLILILLLLVPTFAQEVVEPIRVTISEGKDSDIELADAVRDKLRKLRNVIITKRKPDYTIQLSAARVTFGQYRGVDVAVLVVRHSDGLHDLSIYNGSTSEEIAEYVVSEINQEHFTIRHAKALMKKGE